MWDRTYVPSLQSQDLAWTLTDDEHIAGGGLRKVLSSDPGDGAATSLVQLVHPRAGISDSAMDFFVLEGTGTMNGAAVGPNHYCLISAGDTFDFAPDPPRVVVLVMSFGPATLSASDTHPNGKAPTAVDVDTVAWAQPEWGGQATVHSGALVKWLRTDDLGVVYYSAKLPGWHHDVDEYHPHCEESFRLYGDNLLGSSVSGPGSYFFRPPGIWHGPLYTRMGTTSLIRADVKTVTQTRELPDGGDVQTRRRRAFDYLPHPALQPCHLAQ